MARNDIPSAPQTQGESPRSGNTNGVQVTTLCFIPDVYELRNGTNPYVPDSALASRLTVGASGDYSSIAEALAASTNYSIVAVEPGEYNVGSIEMPAHPVMLACDDGYAIIRGASAPGLFVFADGQGPHTLLRGIYAVLEAKRGFQAAFWCGGNLPWSGAAASPSFENIRVRAPIPGVKYFGWHFYRYNQAASVIRNCTINAAGSTDMTGIYSYDGPPVEIGNCTFVNFPESAAVQVQSSPTNHGMMTESPAVIVEGLALDESFTNAWPLARFEAGTNYVVTMRDCLTPTPPVPPHVPDFMEGVCVTNYFTISPWGNTLRVSLASNFFDNDGDSIPDIWEYVHGLSHTNRYDASADFDGDGLVNLHEYWADCNPAIYDGTNTAIYAAIQSIDNRLTTSNSVGRMAYYSSVSPSAVVVNTNCWAATIPLGSQSPYNATGLRKRAGKLISDMHIVFAHHFPIGNGAKVYFCGSDGSVITNTLLGSRQVVQGNYNYDLRVGILSDSVNTNLVPIAKILPDDYEEYLGIGRALPAVILNQTDECLVFEVSSLLNRSSQVLAEVQASRCLTGIRSVFSKKIQDGDSGNPAYMIVDDEPILLYTLHRAFSGSANSGFDGCAGPSIQRYNAELQQSMNVLSDNYGKSRRTLTYFDLSRFVKLTNWR